MFRNVGDIVKLEPFDIAYSKVSQKYKTSNALHKNILGLSKDMWDDFAKEPVLQLKALSYTGDKWKVYAYDKYNVCAGYWWIPDELIRSPATISKKTANKLYKYFKIKI